MLCNKLGSKFLFLMDDWTFCTYSALKIYLDNYPIKTIVNSTRISQSFITASSSIQFNLRLSLSLSDDEIFYFKAWLMI